MDEICRFCLFGEELTENPLITPCKCRGSQMYVHRRCLRKWINTTTQPHFAVYCQICQNPWILQVRWPLEDVPVTPRSFLWPCYLYILCVLQTCMNGNESERTISRAFHPVYLSLYTFLYVLYYAPCIYNITNKRLYWSLFRSISYDTTKVPFFYMVYMLSTGAGALLHPMLAPFYICGLPLYLTIHQRMTRRMNFLATL